MGITNTKQAVFIVWIPHDFFVEYMPFNKDHWKRLKQTWKFSLRNMSLQHDYV